MSGHISRRCQSQGSHQRRRRVDHQNCNAFSDSSFSKATANGKQVSHLASTLLLLAKMAFAKPSTAPADSAAVSAPGRGFGSQRPLPWISDGPRSPLAMAGSTKYFCQNDSSSLQGCLSDAAGHRSDPSCTRALSSRGHRRRMTARRDMLLTLRRFRISSVFFQESFSKWRSFFWDDM